jgi:acetyl esterase/lipase
MVTPITSAHLLQDRPIDKNFIDMWILGEVSTLDPSPTLSTMLLHGSILRNTKFCARKDRLRVLSIVKELNQASTEESNLKELLRRYRIEAEVKVFHGDSMHDIMVDNSENTSNLE